MDGTYRVNLKTESFELRQNLRQVSFGL